MFAATAAAATIAAMLVLPAGRQMGDTAHPATARLSWSWFICPRSGPLLVGAFLAGLSSSVFWTFGADLASAAAGRPNAGRLLLTAVGLSSIIAGATGAFLDRLDGRVVLPLATLALAASLALLAALPSNVTATVISALLFGVSYNVLIAVQAIWSQRVFASRPATGLGAVSTMVGLGLLLGPAVSGLVGDNYGLPAAFAGSAALVAPVALLLPRERIVVAARPAEAG